MICESFKCCEMTTVVILLQPEQMFRSSIENHRKIAAFLEATAKHLEPSKVAEVHDARVDCAQLEIIKGEIISPYVPDSGDQT